MHFHLCCKAVRKDHFPRFPKVPQKCYSNTTELTVCKFAGISLPFFSISFVSIVDIMDLEVIEESYPAINRALDLLRARLFVKETSVGTSPANEATFALTSTEDTDIKNMDKQTAYVEKSKDPSLRKFSTGLERLAFEGVDARFSAVKTLHQRKRHATRTSVPTEVLAKISSLYSNYITEHYFKSWKLWVNLRQKKFHSFQKILHDLCEAHGFWSRILPESTKINCVQRCGKLQLASLHAKLSLKRLAMIGWIRYCISTRKCIGIQG